MLHPRARTMLLLSIPAVLIGIASSLLLIVVMKIAAVLQHLLWRNLPATFGVAFDSPFWIILMLTLTGIAVGLVIRYSPGQRTVNRRGGSPFTSTGTGHCVNYRPGGRREPRP